MSSLLPFIFSPDEDAEPDVIIGKNTLTDLSLFEDPDEEIAGSIEIRNVELWYRGEVSFNIYGGSKKVFAVDAAGVVTVCGGGSLTTLLHDAAGNLTITGILTSAGIITPYIGYGGNTISVSNIIGSLGSGGGSGNGYTGSQGAVGYTGSAGAGFTGSQGIQGIIGYTGSQGVGFTGSSGPGVSGLTTGTLPKAATATTLTDSLLSESGSIVTVTGLLNVSSAISTDTINVPGLFALKTDAVGGKSHPQTVISTDANAIIHIGKPFSAGVDFTTSVRINSSSTPSRYLQFLSTEITAAGVAGSLGNSGNLWNVYAGNLLMYSNTLNAPSLYNYTEQIVTFSSYAFDLALNWVNGNYIVGMNKDAFAFTFTGDAGAASRVKTLTVQLGAVGSPRTHSWPGSVDWGDLGPPGGGTVTPGDVYIVTLTTFNSGTKIYGMWAGGYAT